VRCKTNGKGIDSSKRKEQIMPIIDGVGVSEYTPYKQKFFTRFVKAHIKISKPEVLGTKHGHYYYFDMNAGSGAYKGPEKLLLGSPMLFIFIAPYQAYGVPYRAILCEANLDNCKRLAANIRLFHISAADNMIYDPNPIEIKRFRKWDDSRDILFYQKRGEEVPEEIERGFAQDQSGFSYYKCAATRIDITPENEGDILRVLDESFDLEVLGVEELAILLEKERGFWAFIEGPAEDLEAEKTYRSAERLMYIVHCDSSKQAPRFSSDLFPGGRKYGLMYIDPNGVGLPVDLLVRLSRNKNYRDIDFLINIAAGTYKRVRINPKTHLEEPLDKVLRKIRKTHWFISQPQGAHQWVFLFGTSQERLNLRRLGLHNTAFPKGKELLHRLSYSEKERRGGILK